MEKQVFILSPCGSKDFRSGMAYFYDGNKAYKLLFSVANMIDGSKVLYAKDKVSIDKPLTDKIKKKDEVTRQSHRVQYDKHKAPAWYTQENMGKPRQTASLDDSKAQNDEYVKKNNNKYKGQKTDHRSTQ